MFSPVVGGGGGGGGLIPKVKEALSAKMNEFPEEKNLILENMLQFFFQKFI